MALLSRSSTGQRWPLAAHALVGRSPACFLQVDGEHTSKEHAVVQWADGQWWVKDLGSRNGTFVDGERIPPGLPRPLTAGCRVAFGRADDSWRFEDDSPPEALALNLSTRAVRVGQGGLLALPSDEAPDVVVLQRSDGHWALERGGRDDREEAGPVQDRHTVAVGADSWCLLLPEPQEATPVLPTALGIESVLFRFGVSRDEERVDLTLVGPHQQVTVQAREFNYVLLTLARARLEDRLGPAAERGWVDREALLKMLRMRSTALNVAIHRARRQLLRVGLVGAAGIVEVRRRARRFGSDRIAIGPLELEAGESIA